MAFRTRKVYGTFEKRAPEPTMPRPYSREDLRWRAIWNKKNSVDEVAANLQMSQKKIIQRYVLKCLG